MPADTYIKHLQQNKIPIDSTVRNSGLGTKTERNISVKDSRSSNAVGPMVNTRVKTKIRNTYVINNVYKKNMFVALSL